jgi:hypothetical protein
MSSASRPVEACSRDATLPEVAKIFRASPSVVRSNAST